MPTSALNGALAARWRKVPDVDSLGNPKFDAIAITSSRIGPDLSTDSYRLGKSLLKKGFTSAAPADAINSCACWDSYRNRLDPPPVFVSTRTDLRRGFAWDSRVHAGGSRTMT